MLSLTCRAVGRAMSSLAETAEALLQFLEEMRAQGRTNLMAVAATRALARYAVDIGTYNLLLR